MSTIIDLFLNLWNAMACIGEVLGYVLRFVSAFFQTRASLAARLLAAESQLGICKRRTEQKGSPRFRFTVVVQEVSSGVHKVAPAVVEDRGGKRLATE